MAVDMAAIAAAIAFGQLLELLKYAVERCIAFRTRLQNINAILRSIEPKMYGLLQDCPEKMKGTKDLFFRGKVLVGQCLSICQLNPCRRCRLSKMLKEYNEALEREFQFCLPLQNALRNCEIVPEVKGSLSGQANGGALQSRPRASGNLRKIGEHLHEEGVSPIAGTGWGGWGKTPLLRNSGRAVAIEGQRSPRTVERAMLKVGPGLYPSVVHDSNWYELVGYIFSGNLVFAQLKSNRVTQELVAIKYIERDDEIDENALIEMTNQWSLRHPNIVGPKEVIFTPTHLEIVMQYAADGELLERICNAGRFSEDEVQAPFFPQQLLSGGGYFHEMVSDGYVSRHINSTVATPAYTGPEVLQGREYDGKRITIPEKERQSRFAKNSPAYLIYEKTMGNHFEEPDQPKQSDKTIVADGLDTNDEPKAPAVPPQGLSRFVTVVVGITIFIFVILSMGDFGL